MSFVILYSVFKLYQYNPMFFLVVHIRSLNTFLLGKSRAWLKLCDVLVEGEVKAQVPAILSNM